MGPQKFGHDHDTISAICNDIKQVRDAGYQISVVVGGGNICRGAIATSIGIERVSADHMGMLATVINALAIQSVLESFGVHTRIQSAIPMTTICESYIRRKAIRHMEKGRVVIFAAGTGNPYFTTDSGAALRAAELNCDAILKGSQVDGVYSDDPRLHPNAVKHEKLTYKEVLSGDLKVLDAAAVTLARENKIPILIFNIHHQGELLRVLEGVGSFSTIQ